MSINVIIENKLKEYNIQSKQDEINALKEIFQEIVLCALSRTDFFKYAGFQGGTCLRILYGLPRFSEDLDFILKAPNAHFAWTPLLHSIQTEFLSYNLNLEAKERNSANAAIKTAFLKEDSFGKILNLSYKRNVSDIQKIQIKLEIDTNPALGSEFESQYLDFPFPFTISLQSFPSLFSGKCHALLCRAYTKGRDWFDFIWYVSRKTSLNYVFLQNALIQTGPWKNQNITIDKTWLIKNLKEKILSTDWNSAKKDVENFLRPAELQSINIWSQNFFLNYLNRLEGYLK